MEQSTLTGEKAGEKDPETEDFRNLSIEDAFARIRDLLAEMDREDVTLEKSFEDYEKGMKLIRYCNERIDHVEKKVQKMNADGSVSDFE